MERRLLVRIEGLLNTEEAGTVDYAIGTYLRHNFSHLHNASLTDISKACNVSYASVSRFVRKLGYDDFFDLKQDLNELAALTQNGMEIFSRFQEGTILPFEDDLQKQVEHMKQVVSEDLLDQAAEAILQSHSVFTMGHWHSGDAALQLSHDLLYLGIDCTPITGVDEQAEYLRSMKEGDCLIIFSCSGNFFRDFFQDTVRFRKPANTKIIMITSDCHSTSKAVDVLINSDTGMGLTGGNLSLFILEKMLLLRCYAKKNQ